MWVLGLTSPVPRNMQWKSVDVERLISGSQAVLKLPSMEIGVRTSFYRSAMMPPSQVLNGNPDHQTLRDVLDPALYRHWRLQKARYLDGNDRVEGMRPILAGRALYEAALQRHGLVDDYGLERLVYDDAARYRIAAMDTSYRLTLNHPNEAVRSLTSQSMDDQACLGQVLDALDQDLSQATARANAWATGDIAALRSILSQTQQDACLSTLDGSQFARALGINDIQSLVRDRWVSSAEHAIDGNRQSFAVLPMHELLDPHGYLGVLQSHGYSVQAPDP